MQTRSPMSPRPGGRTCDGWMERQSCVLLGETSPHARTSDAAEPSARRSEESAAAVVAAAHGSEGPNRESRTGPIGSGAKETPASMAEMPDRTREVGGGTAEVAGSERQARPAQSGAAGDEAVVLMEEMLRRENLIAAHARVVSNGGAPGIDGMTVEALEGHCREHWPRIR